MLGQAELLKATRQSDLAAAAVKTIFDADGTRPVALLGPRQNPQRDRVWTRSYQDASGKVRIVSLLAPASETDAYVGAVGTAVTLPTLRAALVSCAPDLGHALLLGRDGTVLADASPNSTSPSEDVDIKPCAGNSNPGHLKQGLRFNALL